MTVKSPPTILCSRKWLTTKNQLSPYDSAAAVSWSVVSHSLQPHRLQPTRLLCPRGSPGKNARAGSPLLLQGSFLIQGSNLSLLHCRQILYHLSHRGSPWLRLTCCLLFLMTGLILKMTLKFTWERPKLRLFPFCLNPLKKPAPVSPFHKKANFLFFVSCLNS